MSKTLMALTVLLAGQSIKVGNSYAATDDDGQQTPQSSAVNAVVEWNRTLLAIVRTPGAQPATVHPTRSFAIMHAAIYDSVNSIDRTHRSYLVQLSGVSRHASQDAAADAAAHEVLTQLYPAFQAMLDEELQNTLALIPDGVVRLTDGLRAGRSLIERTTRLAQCVSRTIGQFERVRVANPSTNRPRDSQRR